MLSTIAVMTSGDDSPGMNAAVRAVVRTALYEGVKVFGINNGYKGMIKGDIVELDRKSVSDIIQRGGTFLGTGRSEEFMTVEGRKKAFENLKNHEIKGLCVIGGDGSLRGAKVFSEENDIAVVGIPGTINNDIWGTEYTIGCDTAANTVIDAINKLRDTASAHRRCAVLEVMGKKSGWLAMVTGISGGAEYILVPEVDYDLDNIISEMKEIYEKGLKRYILIVISEGVGKATNIAKEIGEKTGIETRPLVLGHIQRGGSPTIIDRVKASQLGERAALALISGLTGVVFGFSSGQIVDINLEDAVSNKKELNPEFVKLSKILA